MHYVDVEFKNGNRISPQFVTQQEAVAYAGRMAQDGKVARSEVRGLDAVIEEDGGPGSGPQEGGGSNEKANKKRFNQLLSIRKKKGLSSSEGEELGKLEKSLGYGVPKGYDPPDGMDPGWATTSFNKI